MSKSIITVDDTTTMRRMVSTALKEAGHTVLEAADGRDALNTLRHLTVDLVITNVSMPNMDGLELTRQLRTLPAFARTPIILLTTESESAKKTQGRAAGATGWIVKPFSKEQLLAVVAKALPA